MPTLYVYIYNICVIYLFPTLNIQWVNTLCLLQLVLMGESLSLFVCLFCSGGKGECGRNPAGAGGRRQQHRQQGTYR